MQREKLYYLQSKAYFNSILFIFKKSKTLSPLQKNHFFLHKREISFFSFHLFIIQYVSLQNEIYHEMQRQKLYNLQRTVYFISVLFVFEKTPNSMRSVFVMAKIGCTEFCFFLKTKIT